MIKQVISYSRQQVKLIFILTILCLSFNGQANERFASDYPCEDGAKQCLSSGTREIEGQQIHRDCWEWSYDKTCEYPSKDNCKQYEHCYSLGQRECLLRDSAGNCVNVIKEFSCKRWEPTYVESETIRYGTEDKQGTKSLICNDSVPCIDGNCFNKRYRMDSDMGHIISALSGLAQAKNIDGFQIWKGTDLHCSKKIAGYSNCCKVYPAGWGKQIGVRCSEDGLVCGRVQELGF